MSRAGRKTQRQGKVAQDYEFFGPPGAFVISFALPILCYLAAFLCNDISGCPVPSALHPRILSVAKLKEEAGWPTKGLLGLVDLETAGWTLAYYGFSLLQQAILPGAEVTGVELCSGGRLKYKFNAFSSAVMTLILAVAGTVLRGPDFWLWTFIWDHYIQLITVNYAIAFALASFVYYRSFSIQTGHADQRELAAGGHSGNMMYDWFIGRELNPRIALPLLGTVDIKAFCELRPGMLGYVLIDLAFVAHQYRVHGFVSDSIVLVTLFQSVYVFDALWMEPAILTTMDITRDGFGFMLAFGDLVWLPFIYSLQARYLAMYPVKLGPLGIVGVLLPQVVGYYIFRAANNEKNRFRTDPDDPRVAHLKYMDTKAGSKIIVSGWWGTARHINYLGDFIMAWSYSLPTGVAGYQIIRDPSMSKIVQGEARGWGMVFTYFYVLYFAILLIHRERRDEEKCRRKYGSDWDEYRKLVPWRILPGIY